MNPSGKDFMDFWLVSVVLPWGALWIWWTLRPVNPLIELSLPEEKTIKGVSSWLQKRWSQTLCFMAVGWLDPISTAADLIVLEAQGRRTVQRQLSLGFVHLFPSDDRGGHVSTWLPLKSSDSLYWTHQYPTGRVKTSSMMIQHGGSAPPSHGYSTKSDLVTDFLFVSHE